MSTYSLGTKTSSFGILNVRCPKNRTDQKQWLDAFNDNEYLTSDAPSHPLLPPNFNVGFDSECAGGEK